MNLIPAFARIYPSPVGDLFLGASEKGVLFISNALPNPLPSLASAPVLEDLATRLDRWFAGQEEHFDLPLDLSHCSEFSQKVYQRLRQIPYGHTLSYHQLAVDCGGPTFTRAVAAANAANPIPIVIPCHRVIGSDGGLTGFAWGLQTKKRFLQLENPRKWAEQGALF